MAKLDEIFLPIKGYEGIYEISNYGNVRTFHRIDNNGRTRKAIVMHPIKTAIGYKEVKLCKFGKGKRISIHRLVSMHFIVNPENKPCVNHIDADKGNNYIENLEWCTYKENTHHGMKIGVFTPRGEDNRCSKLKELDIVFIRTNTTMSRIELAEKFNVVKGHITSIINRITWKHVV